MKTTGSSYDARVRQSTMKLFYWTAGWVLAMAALAFGPRFLWHDNRTATFLAFGFVVGMGIGTVVANKNYLDTLDEMQRRGMLNAMAITFAVPFILGIPYSLLAAYNVAPFKAGIEHLIILMSLTYLTAYITVMRRFR